ncbi:LacI family DNA-binding transcriptional regulator [Saccharopolyspora sp. NPDC050389]|uniref:LacI family DNA-binding transcriptional regulator n=1 Tax=Saccharopolyspora sp. NPDC050389 TaxID=3155516 RepID=UPI0033F75D4D
MTRTPRVSILDVAAHAGVSKSAASRALLGQGDVAEQVRARVEAAAAELGYVKDYRAHALKSTSTRTVGIFVRTVRLSFYGELIATIQHTIESNGFQLAVFAASSDTPTETHTIEQMMGLRPEGIIIASGRVPTHTITGAAKIVPVVLAGRTNRLPGIDTVADDGTGTAALAECVAHHGHRDVAVLSVARSRSATLSARSQRIRKELTALGVNVLPVPLAADRDAADPEHLRRALKTATAVMCPNDPTLITTWEQLDAFGHRVPDDISLTGYDGIGQLASPVLGLTTWRQPIADIGHAVAEQILDRIKNPDTSPRHIRLTGCLQRGRTLRRHDSGLPHGPVQ